MESSIGATVPQWGSGAIGLVRNSSRKWQRTLRQTTAHTGTALGLVTAGVPVQEVAFILSAVVLLSLARLVLRRRLENLM